MVPRPALLPRMVTTAVAAKNRPANTAPARATNMAVPKLATVVTMAPAKAKLVAAPAEWSLAGWSLGGWSLAGWSLAGWSLGGWFPADRSLVG
jgi:hypothetical protein